MGGDVYKINRRFHLDPKTADVEKIDANVVDGVLEVTVQKKKPVYVAVANGPRRIKITTKKTTTTIGNDDDDDVNVNVDKTGNEKESEEAKKDHHEDDDSKECNNNEDSTIAAPATSPSNRKNDTTKVIATNEKAKDGEKTQ